MSEHFGATAAESDEMTLRDYGAVIRRRKWLVIVPALLAMLISLGLSLSQAERYRASADVLVQQPTTAGSVGATGQTMTARQLQNELQRARGSAMQRQVREIVGAEPQITVGFATGDESDVFVFRGVSRNAARAAEAADTYAGVYIADRRATIQADYDAQAEVVQQRIDDLDEQLFAEDSMLNEDQRTIALLQRNDYVSELEAIETSARLAENSAATVIDAATVPSSPFEPTPLRDAMLALVVGLLIGLAAAFLVDYLDNSLRDEADLSKATGLPVLAVIPKLKDWRPSDTHVATREDPSSPTAEAYRALRTSLQFLRIDRKLDVIQVTSPKPGDGKTTTSTNLAVAYAKAGERVVLVDCDLRRPRVHQFFGFSNELGLTSILMGASVDSVTQKVDGEPFLSVIPSGPIPPDPSELLSTRSARELIATLGDLFDVVILDSPPVLVVADPLVISVSSDAVVLVASAKRTDRREVARASEQLAQVEAPVVGAVLNAFDSRSGGSYEYRYSYGEYRTRR